MPGAYSQDLRDRVIDLVIGGKMSRRVRRGLGRRVVGSEHEPAADQR